MNDGFQALAPSARAVGRAIPRREDARLLTGRGSYVDDVTMPGLLHAHFVRSDIARGRIVGIDVADAEALPGVACVLTGATLNELQRGPMRATPMLDMGPGAPERMLATGDVRYVGEPVALVIATSRALAEDAAELVLVDVEAQTPVVDYETAATSEVLVHGDEAASNIASAMAVRASDDLEAVFASAPHVVSHTFRQQRYLPVPMETRGVLAWWDPVTSEFRVWVSTQSPHDVRAIASRITGVPEGQVRVTMGDVGGGFGQKAYLTRDEQVVILAAHHIGRPVKWVEDRRENLMAGTSARNETCTVRLAADDDGRILGASFEHLDDLGAFPNSGSPGVMAALMFPGPYRIPRYAWSTTSVYTNTCPRAPYRGPWQIETFVREQAMDLLARQAGIDPLELRRRNVVHRAELPYTHASGLPIAEVSPEETLEQAAALVDYEAFRLAQQDALAEGRLLGLGLSLYIEPQATSGVYGSEPCHIRVQPNGAVDVFIGSGSHGQGLETTTAQLVSDHLGVDIDGVTVHQGDTASTPYAFGTGGSRSGPVLGAAIRRAALGLREKAVAIAAHQLEAAPDDIEVVDGVFAVRGSPSRSVTMADVAKAAYLALDRLPPGLEPGLEIVSRYQAPGMLFSNACHVAIVEIEAVTGTVRFDRYIVSEDCGVMINPAIVEGQIDGGVVQGIGGVLLEDFVYDEFGTPLTTSFLDYLLPTASDVPTIEHGHIETPAATEGHYKGIGEGGAIASPPAVANAVNDALALVGAQLYEFPMSPPRVWRALATSRIPEQS